MSPAELRADLSERLGERVIDLFTREGGEVSALSDLYQPSPAGFAGRLRLHDGRLLAWDLWLEDGERWNFHAAPLTAEQSP